MLLYFPLSSRIELKSGCPGGPGHQHYGCHQQAGENAGPQHEGILLVSAETEALSIELALVGGGQEGGGNHCYVSRGKKKEDGSKKQTLVYEQWKVKEQNTIIGQ